MKTYILKPGKHQFAPGSHAVHDNDNLGDEEAAWYLEKYPHIAALFEEYPEAGKPERLEEKSQLEQPEVTIEGSITCADQQTEDGQITNTTTQ